MTKYPNNLEFERNTAISIIEHLEGFLDDRDIQIPNKERDEEIQNGEVDLANIYGVEYYDLEDSITEIIKGNSNVEQQLESTIEEINEYINNKGLVLELTGFEISELRDILEQTNNEKIHASICN